MESVPSYLSVVVTCGENIGETERVIQRLFEQKSWALQSFYTLVMPNNYLILGTVDSKEERREKLDLVKEKILHLNKSIAHLKVERQLIKGPLPKLLTTVGGRLFHSFGRSVKPFFANDHCISCKVCEKICPKGCITVEGKPQCGRESVLNVWPVCIIVLNLRFSMGTTWKINHDIPIPIFYGIS